MILYSIRCSLRIANRQSATPVLWKRHHKPCSGTIFKPPFILRIPSNKRYLREIGNTEYTATATPPPLGTVRRNKFKFFRALGRSRIPWRAYPKNWRISRCAYVFKCESSLKNRGSGSSTDWKNPKFREVPMLVSWCNSRASADLFEDWLHPALHL